MKVYITRYALTAGIQECEAKLCKNETMVEVEGRGYFHKPDWWEDRALAVARAEAMRKRKLQSLKKSMQKLDDLSFRAAPSKGTENGR